MLNLFQHLKNAERLLLKAKIVFFSGAATFVFLIKHLPAVRYNLFNLSRLKNEPG
ncbi:MAG: hypothetical protein ACI96G_000302 [Flavobacterium sp.]|jgi:hypothetical protein